jgi:M6 family metalloprotease-like protein
MSLDTSLFYRLTNNFQGQDKALDVKPDGSCRLMMAPTADYSGQFWRLVDLGGGKYALRTLYLGDCFSLDVINDGVKNDTPWLYATGGFTGQSWSLSPWGDGTYKLSNDFTGPDRSLNVYDQSFDLFMGSGNFSGQHWHLTPLRKISPPAVVPALGTMLTNNAQNEAPTNYSVFARPTGTIRAVMIFVDFPDAASSEPPAPVGDHVLGQLKQLYHEQSYGKLSIEVDVKSELGWRRMPRNSSGYDLENLMSQTHYITEAASLFSSDIKFSDYRFVYIIPCRNAVPPLSPAFNPNPPTSAPTPSGDIHLGVTMGQDAYHNRYITLVHETGHLFGLPDLYWSGKPPDVSEVGCWDIMSDTYRSMGFIGWHRHKFGWLDPSRELYLSDNTEGWYTTVSPLSAGCGLSMIVLPIDGPSNPTKVFAVEIAQPILGFETDRPGGGDGILMYTVDAKIPSAMAPVVVLRNVDHQTREFGRLYDVPFGVSEWRSYTVDGVTLEVSVLQKFGSSYNIRIKYSRSSSWIADVIDAARGLIGELVQSIQKAFHLPATAGRLPMARPPATAETSKRDLDTPPRPWTI